MENLDPYRTLLVAMKEQDEEDKQFFERAQSAMEDLNLHNSIAADLVVQLAEDLTEYALTSDLDGLAEMEIDRIYGKGINLYLIVHALNEYEEEDNTEYLDVALAYILREKERRILNEE